MRFDDPWLRSCCRIERSSSRARLSVQQVIFAYLPPRVRTMTGRWKNGDCGEDLYCKLGAFTINVPPLRKRRDEIIVLMHHLMHRLWRQYGLAARTFSPALSVRAEITPGRKTSKSLRPFVKRYLVVGDKDLPHNGIGNDLTRIREGGALLPPKP